MFFELIASFVAGLGAAGLVLALDRLTGRHIPRWIMPAAAGLAMVGYAIWSEYSWAPRTVAGLPDGVVEVERIEERKPWKPWTYAVPQATRLLAVDAGGAATHPAAPGLRLVTLYAFARWHPTRAIPQLVDCGRGARADVSDAALADPSTAAWRPLERGDGLLAAVCVTTAD
ncbi:hypothetical protein [Rhodovulum adriaticum]|uniref:Uncharacterized protein n=1 Tax=Rhodovulum adriaticum TaxID=35804 RepID=A0A4R2NKT8_RHOAD|nr:hypothetical protein [Rhodovulum adriaticum]MBK1637022.1 hypothetical protein [Rhodovulum adriaticum]TCP22002.1 hypothetical protein EV656_10848 [Rhodovulum adriaticum]